MIKAILQSLEERLLKCEVRKDAKQISKLLTDDFREFGAAERAYTKAEIIDALLSEEPVAYSLRDFETYPLSEGAVLATYISIRKVLGQKPVEAMRSSVWVLRDDRWQMLFHQGTRIKTLVC